MPAPLASARLSIFLAANALAFAACSFDPHPPGGGLSSTGGSAGHTGAGGGAVIIGGTAGSGSGTAGAGGPITGGGGPGAVVPIPAGYTNVETGAFKLGDPIPANGGTMNI